MKKKEDGIEEMAEEKKKKKKQKTKEKNTNHKNTRTKTKKLCEKDCTLPANLKYSLSDLL